MFNITAPNSVRIQSHQIKIEQTRQEQPALTDYVILNGSELFCPTVSCLSLQVK